MFICDVRHIGITWVILGISWVLSIIVGLLYFDQCGLDNINFSYCDVHQVERIVE